MKLDAIQFPESEMRSLFGRTVTTKRATLRHLPFAPLAKDQLKALNHNGQGDGHMRHAVTLRDVHTHAAYMRAPSLQDGLADSSY